VSIKQLVNLDVKYFDSRLSSYAYLHADLAVLTSVFMKNWRPFCTKESPCPSSVTVLLLSSLDPYTIYENKLKAL
jgi:hypothetical protein